MQSIPTPPAPARSRLQFDGSKHEETLAPVAGCSWKVNILSALSAEGCVARFRKRLWWWTPPRADFGYCGSNSKNKYHRHARGAGMLLCPFPDPHWQELAVWSVPYEKSPNASRIFHICLLRVSVYFLFVWEEGLGQSSRLSFMGEAAMKGRGKGTTWTHFPNLLFSQGWTETAAFDPLIIHKPPRSITAIKECYKHFKFKCAERSARFKPD